MGYTHHWTVKKKHDDTLWNKFVCDCIDVKYAVLGKIDLNLGDGKGEEPSPEFSNHQICFNGIGKDAYETFQLTKSGESGFCKTECKPYNFMVCICLILYKHYFPKDVFISSDGWHRKSKTMDGHWEYAFTVLGKALPDGKEISFEYLFGDSLFEEEETKGPGGIPHKCAGISWSCWLCNHIIGGNYMGKKKKEEDKVKLIVCKECGVLLIEVVEKVFRHDTLALSEAGTYDFNDSSDCVEHDYCMCPLCYGNDEKDGSIEYKEFPPSVVELILALQKELRQGDGDGDLESKHSPLRYGVPLDEPKLKLLLTEHLI
jgi:hypothetical protein